MNKKLIIIFLLILVLVGATYVWWQKREEDTTGWQTYKNEQFGFEFKYPHGWNVREEDFVKTQKNPDIVTLYKNGEKDDFIQISPIDRYNNLEKWWEDVSYDTKVKLVEKKNIDNIYYFLVDYQEERKSNYPFLCYIVSKNNFLLELCPVDESELSPEKIPDFNATIKFVIENLDFN